MWIGTSEEVKYDYGFLLSHSKYCLVLPGRCCFCYSLMPGSCYCLLLPGRYCSYCSLMLRLC